MSDFETVTVYSFQVIEFGPERSRLATFKAPRDLILNKFKGEPLEGSGEDVRIADLDAEGRYRRVATGWGELR